MRGRLARRDTLGREHFAFLGSLHDPPFVTIPFGEARLSRGLSGRAEIRDYSVMETLEFSTWQLLPLPVWAVSLAAGVYSTFQE